MSAAARVVKSPAATAVSTTSAEAIDSLGDGDGEADVVAGAGVEAAVSVSSLPQAAVVRARARMAATGSVRRIAKILSRVVLGLV
ncbi:hypothetical protein GCM10023168_04600 [Fodinibacter luteus]|uniref:Uncharacterized protein n=1 Tax=Fodinibacter luteus TaxID=552064 RepID=A0ABP8JZY5_9MICO